MNNKGIIPPHFLNFIEQQGIVCEYFKGNIINQTYYDRFIVNIPFSVDFLKIQVIFDCFDYRTQPEIILLNHNCYVDHDQIFKEWNFKDSSTLLTVLLKIKKDFQKSIEIKFINEMQLFEKSKISKGLTYETILQVYQAIYQTINQLKKRFTTYSHNKKLHIIEFLHKENLSDIDRLESESVVSFYPDYLFKSKAFEQSAMINIHFKFNYDLKFYFTVSTIGNHMSSIRKIKTNYDDIAFLSEKIKTFENIVIKKIKQIEKSETFVTAILKLNLGTVLHYDNDNFSSLTINLVIQTNRNKVTSNRSSKRVIIEIDEVEKENENVVVYFNIFANESEMLLEVKVNSGIYEIQNKMIFTIGEDIKKSLRSVEKYIQDITKTLN